MTRFNRGEAEEPPPPIPSTNREVIMGSEINYNYCYECGLSFTERVNVYLIKLTPAQKKVQMKAPPMLCRPCTETTTEAYRYIGVYRFIGSVQK